MTSVLRKTSPKLIAIVCLAVVVVGLLIVSRRSSSNDFRARVLGTTAERVTSTNNGNGSSKPNNGNGNGTPGQTFRITGAFEGLYPGMSGPNAKLTISAANDNNFAIVVQSLTATATAVDAAHSSCPLTLTNNVPTVRVTSFNGNLTIAQNTSAQQKLDLTMDAGAPDSCSGATFTLTYGGTAIKAGQQ